MLKSVYENGGFYIGRYETTINGTKYVTSTFTTEVLRTSGTNTYTIKVYGYRVPFLSMYENIIEVKE